MAKEHKLIAWITTGQHGLEAAFVSEGTKREPARRTFRDQEAARKWVEHEAAELGAAISWVT
jgi:hypothetical protein